VKSVCQLSLLRGFVMKGISLKERDGNGDFIGTLDKPSVGMNQAAMGKQLGREIRRFIERGLTW